MKENEITWFYKLIKKDRINNNSPKRKMEIMELLYCFVDNCPSKEGPFCAKKFVDYGFKNYRSYGKYKEKLIESIKLSKDSYQFFASNRIVETWKSKIEYICNIKKKPTIFFAKGTNSEIDSLFIRIRNAFAHGNYFKKGNYYTLWNEGSNHDKLNCFIVLKYSHLMNIFELLTTFQN